MARFISKADCFVKNGYLFNGSETIAIDPRIQESLKHLEESVKLREYGEKVAAWYDTKPKMEEEDTVAVHLPEFEQSEEMINFVKGQNDLLEANSLANVSDKYIDWVKNNAFVFEFVNAEEIFENNAVMKWDLKLFNDPFKITEKDICEAFFRSYGHEIAEGDEE